MKKIIIFNHKGGVSKTTSTFYIGWMIAELGHKVLIVDADPQCNLTELFLGEKFDEYYESEGTKDNNIMDGAKPAFLSKLTPITPINCPRAEGNENLYLIPGHMNLSEYEAQLSFAFSTSSTLPVMANLPGAFNDLIEKTAKEIEAEYVIIDVNPALSVINEDLFIISDAFIIPTNPDMFSIMAIRSLANILPRWKTWKDNNIEFFKESAYPLPEGSPKFIGTIPQRFNIRNGKATKPFRQKIDDLATVSAKDLVPKLKAADMMLEESKYKNANIPQNTYILEEIKDFLTLSPRCMELRIPVYKLTEEQLNATGVVKANQMKNVQEFYALYLNIANEILVALQ